MRIAVTVQSTNDNHRTSATEEIPRDIEELFEPIETSDAPIHFPYTTGPIKQDSYLPTDARVYRKLALREGAAERLAHHLAEMIVEHMAKNDTHNGYKKEDS